ncbi:MAG: Coq4 family protein [Maricaulaceae bacterium]
MTTHIMHPDRTTPRFRPFKALSHFKTLIQNKEDTTQVFYIIEALNGKSLLRDLKKFQKTKLGQQRISEARYLPPLLDDHDALRKLPENSVGAAYMNFMQREGLSAAGLVAEYDQFAKDAYEYGDLIEWYGNRLRDTHDLLHVLTGYGRDALGEACVLGFSYSQNKSLGAIFIAYMAAREIAKTAPRGAPVIKAVREGQRNGKASLKLAEQDIMSLLHEPLDSARKRLGIAPPTQYDRVHAMFEENGVDPHEVLGAAVPA